MKMVGFVELGPELLNRKMGRQSRTMMAGLVGLEPELTNRKMELQNHKTELGQPNHMMRVDLVGLGLEQPIHMMMELEQPIHMMMELELQNHTTELGQPNHMMRVDLVGLGPEQMIHMMMELELQNRKMEQQNRKMEQQNRKMELELKNHKMVENRMMSFLLHKMDYLHTMSCYHHKMAIRMTMRHSCCHVHKSKSPATKRLSQHTCASREYRRDK
jgi:hypothetical protein